MKLRSIFSILVCLLLAMALAMPAYADEGGGDGNGDGGGGETHQCSFGAWTSAGEAQHVRSCSCGKTETGSHSWDGGTTTTEPGCNTKGVITKTCTVCGETATSEIAPTGKHVFTGWTPSGDGKHTGTCACGQTSVESCTMSSTVVKQPTCKEAGYKETKCTVCGGGKSEEIPKTTSHQYGNWINVDSGTHKHVCATCGKEDTGNHIWNDRKVTLEATCTKTGTMTYTCACGASKTETLEKTAHAYDNVCDPDCNVCGEIRQTEHKPGKTWSRDASGHWHICSACKDKVDVGKHFPGPAATEDKDQICLTCGYLLTAKKGHIHKYQTTFTSDENGHWYACEGCADQKDLTEHTYDDPCDPDCNVCGYKRDSAHYYGDSLQFDETSHWGICTLCGEVGSRDAHIPDGEATEDKPQTCVVCGMEMAPALEHVHEAQDWVKDELTHRKVCDCGEILEEGEHTWGEGTQNPDTTVTYTCTQCGAEKTEGQPRAERAFQFPWVPVVVILSLLCVAAAAVILIRLLMKKPSGRFSR